MDKITALIAHHTNGVAARQVTFLVSTSDVAANVCMGKPATATPFCPVPALDPKQYVA